MTNYSLITADALKEVGDPQDIVWPRDATLIIAHNGTKESISGRLAITNSPCIQRIWVKPEHRKGLIGYKLMQYAEWLHKIVGQKSVMALMDDSKPELAGYLERMGYRKMPFTLYAKEINNG